MMKNTILIFVLGVFTLNCSEKRSNHDAFLEEGEKVNEKELKVESKTQASDIEKVDTIRLSEHFIDDLAIPFKHKEMLPDLKKLFRACDVSKELGQQDGPDFPLYSVKKDKKEILFFGMEWEDTLVLNEIYIKSPIVMDEYGLKVGDGYRKIEELRSGKIEIFTNLHQHTYAYIDGSNIFYEIYGDVSIPDTADFENLKFTNEQVKNWTIDHLIWRKKK